jgi:hypothetical protein
MGTAWRTVAAVKQHQCGTGVDDHRRERDLHLSRRQQMGLGVLLHLLRLLIVAENGMRSIEHDSAVIDRRDLEGAQLEAVMGRL